MQKFYLAPILSFELYKQLIISEMMEISKSNQRVRNITDNTLKRAAWVTGGVHRLIADAAKKSKLLDDAEELSGDDNSQTSLSEFINKWSPPELMKDLWEPNPLWTILQMFDQNSPSNEVSLLLSESHHYFFTFAQCKIVLSQLVF